PLILDSRLIYYFRQIAVPLRRITQVRSHFLILCKEVTAPLREQTGGFMVIRHALSIAAAALIFSALAGATPLAVNNVAVEIPLGPGIPHAIETDFNSPRVLLSGTSADNPDIGLPGYAGDTIFLKFRSDYLGDIEAINSFSITITFADNAQDGGETARVPMLCRVRISFSRTRPSLNSDMIPIPIRTR